jgi:UDP-N-acetylmuramoyl-tripeptide--D-alanyl-D-alanine ligase
VTPGLVESDRASNEEIASIASEIFDLVIVTGDLNYEIFARFIDSDSLLHLRDKEDMQSMLAKETREGDLILFANDAPSFV